jgi:selT/selW/selH-like putative selenoprotein
MITSKMPEADVMLRRSAGGVFEIAVDGRLRFSKKAAGRFPTEAEILEALG